MRIFLFNAATLWFLFTFSFALAQEDVIELEIDEPAFAQNLTECATYWF